MFQVRKTTQHDIPHLIPLFELGRQIQIQSGNLNQWKPGYPSEAQLLSDIAESFSYVVEYQGDIVASFYLSDIPDPTYAYIEDGAWLDATDHYVTIHRIVASNQLKGIGRFCIEWVQARYDNIRIDTHEDNVIMHHLMAKLGFQHCGTIYLADGDPRWAYQWVQSLPTL